MTILTDADLEFARRHLERFEDSDFFPQQEEFADIWSNWEYFKGRITSLNVGKLPLSAASVMPVAKGRVGYRIVHQLEPLTAIAYTALTHSVAGALESSRASHEVACSYRYAPNDGAFFSEGRGYERFRERSETLCQQFDYGATVDIADFYNQIYSHRVRGSIEASSAELANQAHDMERVIHSINTGASKGIPVGSDSSAVLAEGILIDVDQLLSRSGVHHTRYVDDIRMFHSDEQKLQNTIEYLSEYLYEYHRLHLNSGKTKLLPSQQFLDEVIRDHVDDETEAALNLLGQYDPYGEEDIAEEDIPEEDIIQQIGGVIREKYEANGFVDLNLTKAYIRRARIAQSDDFVMVARNSLDAFVPTIHELGRALSSLISLGGVDTARPLIDELRSSSHYRRKAVRYWVDWVCAGSAELLSDPTIREDVFGGALRLQAKAALTTSDLAWVRAQRATFVHLPPMQRSAVIRSMRLIGRDERQHLLGQIDDNTASPVDVAVKRAVLA